MDFENAREVSRIRLSSHFYTDDAELDSAFAAIDEIRATGAWHRWQGHPSLVT